MLSLYRIRAFTRPSLRGPAYAYERQRRQDTGGREEREKVGDAEEELGRGISGRWEA